jgi:hypothetical protein
MFKLLLKESYTSQNLFEKVNLLEKSLITTFSNGMGWVINNNIDSVLIGGTAVINYLSSGRDLTPDVDYMVDNIGTVKQKLDRDNIKYDDIRDNNNGNLGITVPKFNMDFIDSNKGNKSLNKTIVKLKGSTVIGGITVPIVRPELLAIMKLELGRTKDIEDGFELLKSGKVNKEMYIKILDTLKNSLSDYESLKNYSAMIK